MRYVDIMKNRLEPLILTEFLLRITQFTCPDFRVIENISGFGSSSGLMTVKLKLMKVEDINQGSTSILTNMQATIWLFNVML